MTKPPFPLNPIAAAIPLLRLPPAVLEHLLQRQERARDLANAKQSEAA